MSRIASLLNRPEALLFDLVVDSVALPRPPAPQPRDARVRFPPLAFHRAIPPPAAPPLRPEGYLISPVELGFIPVGHWLPGVTTLASAIADFFTARSSRILRFECKLWNALALTRADPALYRFVGVAWVSRSVLKVNREVFGRFINVTRPAAALYNNQGSFATHGFRELAKAEVGREVREEELADVEESVVRLFQHLTPLFNAYSRPEEVMACRYVQSSW
jgi:hypothetical protein